MTHSRYTLDPGCRAMTLRSIVDVCQYRGWALYAAHVRVDHIHVVVDAEAEPSRVVGDLKAYSSRSLNRAAADCAKRWARHASVRTLRTADARERAIHYVVMGQGEPMAVFVR